MALFAANSRKSSETLEVVSVFCFYISHIRNSESHGCDAVNDNKTSTALSDITVQAHCRPTVWEGQNSASPTVSNFDLRDRSNESSISFRSSSKEIDSFEKSTTSKGICIGVLCQCLTLSCHFENNNVWTFHEVGLNPNVWWQNPVLLRQFIFCCLQFSGKLSQTFFLGQLGFSSVTIFYKCCYFVNMLNDFIISYLVLLNWIH